MVIILDLKNNFKFNHNLERPSNLKIVVEQYHHKNHKRFMIKHKMTVNLNRDNDLRSLSSNPNQHNPKSKITTGRRRNRLAAICPLGKQLLISDFSFPVSAVPM